jgi:phenylacetic acid degradation operon negative regulatory protein
MATDTSISTRTLVLGSVRDDGLLDARDLYGIARACGMTDLQVRLCLRRLVAQGALEHVRGRGQGAQYVARGETAREILPELEYVEFAYRQDAGLEPWDGRWRLVGFTIAEEHRALRDELRERLRYLGWAQVNGGLYASPHPWDEVVAAEAERLGVTDALTLVESDRFSLGGVCDPRALADRMWPLASVAAGYRDFQARLAARVERLTADDKDLHVIGGEVFATAVDFSRAIEPDPLLPPELLPPAWAGMEARRDLARAHRRLADSGLGDRLPAVFHRLAVAVPGVDVAAGGSAAVC